MAAGTHGFEDAERKPAPHEPVPGTDAGKLLSAPATPAGREHELENLRSALDAAATGTRRVVLVAGSAGVGKSSLIAQLQPLAQARGGYFVAGKFEQHNETEAIAVIQALSALGCQLLNRAPEEIAEARSKILRALGGQAALARVIPEFASLLSDLPDPRAVNPAHASARMAEVVAGLLRAIASPARPLVLVLDDLQWSGALVIRLVDAVLAAHDLAGLLLVAAYRHDELPETHPLALAISRWGEEAGGPQLVQLANLPQPSVSQLLARMLALPSSSASRLADALAPHAHGNPYDTVELVNALRDEGLLDNATGIWRWDDAAVRQCLARTGVKQVLAGRIGRLPAPALQLLQALACLGTQTSREVARTALALGPEEIDTALSLLFDQGFVLREAATDGVLRLRHDRVQQAVYSSLPEGTRGAFHLTLARRLAVHASLASVAAGQYLFAVDEVGGLPECRRAAVLLRDAATQARLIGNHVAAYGMQKAALCLFKRACSMGDSDTSAMDACEIEFHVVLCTVGRLDEADHIYHGIEARHAHALSFIDAACAQVSSLTNRDRLDDAFNLGLKTLQDLGLSALRNTTPGDFLQRYERLRGWVEAFDLEAECARAETVEPWVVAAAKMMEKLVSPAILTDIKLAAWIIFQSQELWERHGACGPLIACFSRAGAMTTALMQDARTGYLAGRLALDFCESRGWELETAQARCAFISHAIHWFEPLERKLKESERAREGLLIGGDLRDASFTTIQTAACLFECGPSLRRYADEVETAFALSRRADNRQGMARCVADRQLLRAFLGEQAYPVLPEEHYIADGNAQAWLVSYRESTRVIACAILADGAGLSRHARLAADMRKSVQIYPLAWGYWLSGLAAAWELQGTFAAAPKPGREPMADLEACIEWLRQRAIDAPFNFRHMHLHLVAERAWALGDREAAVCCFDDALGATDQTCRPWHQALITERAARLHLAQGWTHSGRQLLLEAQKRYATWGATVKVEQLSAETGMRVQADTHKKPGGSVGGDLAWLQAPGLDALPMLRALHVLSAETNAQRLKTKVEEVLRGVTGATKVVLATRDDVAGWVVTASHGGTMPLTESALMVPLTAFHFAERTREPLVLEDAVVDDRFARDVYFQGMERCSLMVVPMLNLGQLRAMLVLENRDTPRAFSTQQLDLTMMFAAQLAVSLESAQLYERLERKVDEQSQQLREAQERLVAEARRSGMAQIATNVLHNVGNVLTSVNVSVHMLVAQVRRSRTARVDDLAQLLEASAGEFGRFFADGEKGLLLPGYLRELALALQDERSELLGELDRLEESVDHIKNVVALQQSFAAECAGPAIPIA